MKKAVQVSEKVDEKCLVLIELWMELGAWSSKVHYEKLTKMVGERE